MTLNLDKHQEIIGVIALTYLLYPEIYQELIYSSIILGDYTGSNFEEQFSLYITKDLQIFLSIQHQLYDDPLSRLQANHN